MRILVPKSKRWQDSIQEYYFLAEKFERWWHGFKIAFKYNDYTEINSYISWFDKYIKLSAFKVNPNWIWRKY